MGRVFNVTSVHRLLVLPFQLDRFYVEVFYNTATKTVSFVKGVADIDGIEA